MSTRLDTIITRQRKSRMRDLAFAAFIAMIVAIGATSVGVALDATDAIAKR